MTGWPYLKEILAEYDENFDRWGEIANEGQEWREKYGLDAPEVRRVHQADRLLAQGKTEQALREYDQIVEEASSPKIQLEIACLLLARCGLPRDVLAWAYPFHLFDEYAELFARSKLDHLLRDVPLCRGFELARIAVKAAGRTHAFFFGFEFGEWERPYSLAEAWMWVQPAARALGLAFAGTSKMQGDLGSNGAQAVVDFFQEWLPNEAFPDLVASALPSPLPPATTEPYLQNLQSLLRGNWGYLCREARRHLLSAELYWELAQTGQIEGDEVLLRFARALEAQVNEVLARVYAPDKPPRFLDFVRWQRIKDGEIPSRKPSIGARVESRIKDEASELWGGGEHFLLNVVPDFWKAFEQDDLRNRAAHGWPASRPVRVATVGEIRSRLLEEKIEGYEPFFAILAELTARLTRPRQQ